MASNTVQTAQPQILVVDSFVELWPQYRAALPKGREALLVPDTSTAWKAFEKYSNLQVVVIQGYAVHQADVSNAWLHAGPEQTAYFVRCLRDERGFRGKVFVVSAGASFGSIDQQKMAERGAPDQVVVLEKSRFLQCAATLLGDELFESPLRLPEAGHWSVARQVLEGLDHPTAREVLEWINAFEQTVRTGNTLEVYRHMTAIGLEGPEPCGCSCANPWERWHHDYRVLLNLGVWEILAARPGLLDLVRWELENELDKPFANRTADELRWLQSLRSFLLVNGPTNSWLPPHPA